MPEAPIRGDLDLLNRPILCAQPGRAFLQLLAAHQALQDIADDRWISMELRDVMPDIFVGGISKKLQFCGVGAQDGAVASNDMKREGPVFEEILQVLRVGIMCTWRVVQARGVETIRMEVCHPSQPDPHLMLRGNRVRHELN